jgi:uncharacterized protein YqeY
VSDLVNRIAEDQKSAMRARERERLSTLRLLSSELKNRRIELQRDLTDEDAIEVLARALKQRLEAAEQYEKGGRSDLASRETAEAAIIQEYLPEPISEGELDGLIDAAIAEVGATSARDMGAVMKRLMPMVKGRADGAAVSARVRERLG